MKNFTSHIVVFVLLLGLFCMVALTSSWSDKFADDQVSRLSDNSSASMPQGGVPAGWSRSEPLRSDVVEPASGSQQAPFTASVSPPSGGLDKPKPKARLAVGRKIDLGEDQKAADPNDNFVYTEDVVE